MGVKRTTDLPAAATPLAGTELVEVSQLSDTVTITAATISALASDNSFNDSANGFVAAGFAVGDRVNVTGFTGNVANNILVGTLTDVTTGKLTVGGVDGDVIVDDAAGESVTISKWESRRVAADDLGGDASYPDFTGHAGGALVVNDTEDGVEWGDAPGGGGGGGPKAFVDFTPGSPPTINDSFGVASVTRTGTGRYQITFTEAFDSTRYIMAAHGRFSDAANDALPIIGIDRRTGFDKTTTVVDVTITNDSTSATDALSFVNLAFFEAARTASPSVTVSALYEDQKAAGTTGGASVAGSWLTRTLNTEVFDDIGISLASNQLTLPAGTYDVDASTPIYKSDRCRARLQDVTNGVTLVLSDSQNAAASDSGQAMLRVTGRFTLAAPANVELQYRVLTAQASNGLGVEGNFGDVEVYSRVRLTKVASGLVKLGSVVAAGGEASLTISDIPGSFENLLLTGSARGSANADINITFNGDTGANYDFDRQYAGGSEGGEANNSQNAIDNVWGMTSTASIFAALRMTLFGYARLDRWKAFEASAALRTASGNRFTAQAAGYWKDTDPITSITFTPSTGAFAAGSRIDVWGIR